MRMIRRRVVSSFAEDGEMLLTAGPGISGTRLKGHEELSQGLQARFDAAPDIRWTDGRSWIFGNKALSEWRVIGTLASGGKIVKKDTYYKQATG